MIVFFGMPINPKKVERDSFAIHFFVIITPVKYYGGRNYTTNQGNEHTTHAINGIHNHPRKPPKKENPTLFVVRPAGVRCRPSGAPLTVPRPPLLARTHRTRNTTTISKKRIQQQEDNNNNRKPPKNHPQKKNPPKKPKPPTLFPACGLAVRPRAVGNAAVVAFPACRLSGFGLRSRRRAASRWQCGPRGVSRSPSSTLRLDIGRKTRAGFSLTTNRAPFYGARLQPYHNGYHPPAPPVRLYPCYRPLIHGTL